MVPTRGLSILVAVLSVGFLVSAAPGTTADLAVAVVAPARVMVGDDLQVAVTVTNDGPDPVGAVTLDVTLPSQVSFGSVGSSQGTCTGSSAEVTCDLGALADGSIATVDVLVAPIGHGPIVETATVSAGDNADPTPSNDTASASTNAIGPDCTIVGTWGDDTLEGTSGDDVNCGLGGNDTLSSVAGDNVLLGGSGDDTLLAGTGTDLLFGMEGNDLLVGGPGGDLLSGGPGQDTLQAGSGVDTCLQGPGEGTQDCPGNIRPDGRDTRGPLDISSVRVSPGTRRLGVTIQTFSRWTPLQIWDHGYFVVTIDTAGDSTPDYEALVRSSRTSLVGELMTAGGKRIAKLRAVHPSGRTVKVSIPLGRIRFERTRLYYRWQAETIWDAPPCSRVCFDLDDDAGPAPEARF